MFLRQLTLGVALLPAAACGMSVDAPTEAEETAYSRSAPPVGEPVEYSLYTHCGVESPRLDGRCWHAVDPLYGDLGPGSAPEGWGDPYERGELTVHSEQHVTFESDGIRVAFVPAEDNRPMRLCR